MGTRVNGESLDAGTSGPALSDATPAALGVAAAGVSTEASRADHVHAAPTRTALDLSDVAGWTVAAGTGSATIDTGDETADLGIPSGMSCVGDATPVVSYPLDAPEEWDVRARLVDLSGGAGGSPRAALDVASAASGETGVSLVSVWVAANGSVELLTFIAGSGTSRGTVAASLPRSGTGWVRVRRRDGLVSVYYGTGVGTAPPTVWRCSHRLSWAAADPTVALGHVRVRALHFGTGSSTAVAVSWADVSFADLGVPT